MEKMRRQCDVRGSDQSDVATSQGSQGMLTTAKSWKRQKGSSPRASRRSITCQYLGCRIVDFGASKEYIFVVIKLHDWMNNIVSAVGQSIMKYVVQLRDP